MTLPPKTVTSGCRNFLDFGIDYPMWKSIQSCPTTPNFIDPERSFLVNHSLDIFEGHRTSEKRRFLYLDVFQSKPWPMRALCYTIRKSGACATKPLTQNLYPSWFVRLVWITTQNTIKTVVDFWVVFESPWLHFFSAHAGHWPIL